MPSSLKVVFKSSVRGIAQAGDVKNVSAGYARNFLFPRELAFPAADGAMRQWETQRQGTLAKAAKLKADAEAIAQKIDSLTLSISAKASDEGRLFGSITKHDIKAALAKEGVQVDRRAIELVDALKQIGQATVPVQLGHGVTAQLKISVVGENV